MIYTYEAERLISDEPLDVHAAIADVVRKMWDGRTHVVAEERLRRVDAVTVELGSDEPDVWLTWELTPVAGATRVRLVLEELDQGPDATEAIAEMLSLLGDRLAKPQWQSGPSTPK
jgi:hypothetical protein